MVYRLPDEEATREREKSKQDEARELEQFGRGVHAFPWRTMLLAVALFTIVPQAGCAAAGSVVSLWSDDVAGMLLALCFGWSVGLTVAFYLFPILRLRWAPHAVPIPSVELAELSPRGGLAETRLRVSVAPAPAPNETASLLTEDPSEEHVEQQERLGRNGSAKRVGRTTAESA